MSEKLTNIFGAETKIETKEDEITKAAATLASIASNIKETFSSLCDSIGCREADKKFHKFGKIHEENIENITKNLVPFIGHHLGDVAQAIDCEGIYLGKDGHHVSFSLYVFEYYIFVCNECIRTESNDINYDAIIMEIILPYGSSIKGVTQCNTIYSFNQTLSNEAQLEIVTHEQFKEYHKDNKKSTKFENMVADINYVRRIFNKDIPIGYEIHLDKNPSWIKVYFDGTIDAKNAPKLTARLTKNGHTRINYQNNPINIERLILAAKAVLDNELPTRFPRGLVANVLDGSGSFITANRLRIKQNFSIENLEWTTNSRNSMHGTRIDTMYKLGLVSDGPVRFSANDTKLFEILDLKNKDAVKKYWIQNYGGGDSNVN